jgi:hypothetical protein
MNTAVWRAPSYPAANTNVRNNSQNGCPICKKSY